MQNYVRTPAGFSARLNLHQAGWEKGLTERLTRGLPPVDCTAKLEFADWMDLVCMFPRRISARTASVSLSLHARTI
jgi:hypothetical protein